MSHKGLSFGIRGFIDLEITDKDGNKTREKHHNMITRVGQQYILTKGVANALNNSPVPFGNFAIVGAPMQKLNVPSTSQVNRQCDASDAMTNVLLNLTAGELAALVETTPLVKTWDTNVIGTLSKVIGYANNNIAPVADGKEGNIDYLTATYMLENLVAANHYVYGTGVALGTVNAMAMMPKAGMKGQNGLRACKAIDKVNQQYANFGAYSTEFLPPGVTGYTTDSEILLNYGQDTKTKHKYNYVTGEMTDMADTDPWLTLQSVGDPSYFLLDWKVIGGYLYVLKGTVLGSATASSIYLYTVDLATGLTVSTKSFTYYYIRGAKLLYINTKLYVIAYDAYNTNSSNYARVREITKSGAYYDTIGISNYTLAAAGITIGGKGTIDDYGIMISNYGDNYAVQYGVVTNSTSNYNSESPILICSDLTDIYGTLVDIIPTVKFVGQAIFSNAVSKGVLELGAPGGYDTVSMTDARKNVVNNTSTVVVAYSGLWVSLEGWWSNAFSIVKLTEAKTKGATDIWDVTYGYEIVTV